MTPEVIKAPGALEATTRGEIDIQISTARRYPRDVKKALSEARRLMTFDEKTAEECIYRLPRDGKEIEGPSIRAAEILANAWGNLRIAAKVIEDGERKVTCLAACHDLETNVAVSVEVQRRITDKSGRRYTEDMVITTSNAGCAVAFRNAVLKIIPKAVWKPAFEAAQKKAGEKNLPNLNSRRINMIEWFGRKGVGVDAILKKVKRVRVGNIGEDDLVQLNQIASAIDDGRSTAEELFDLTKNAPEPEGPQPNPPESQAEGSGALFEKWKQLAKDLPRNEIERIKAQCKIDIICAKTPAEKLKLAIVLAGEMLEE